MDRRNLWLGTGGIIIVAAVIAFLLIHNPKATTPAHNNSQPPTSQTSGNSTNKPKVVTIKNNTSNGEYLAAANGKPLYTYSADTTGVSNCAGSCLETWPIYEATSSSASLPANVTIIARSDGTAQYAYKGMPLYYFASDISDIPTGDGVGGFNLAKP